MKCNFCDDILEKNRMLGLPEEETILYEDENIYVVPDISPLAIGHLLIISKKHFQSFASADAKTIESVKSFFQYYKKRIGNRIFSIFEHGAVVSYYAGASIDHAHMHILPFELDIKQKIANQFGNPKQYKLEKISELKERMQSYFYCQLSSEDSGWIFEVQKVPSQILRKMANELLESREIYDWKLQYQNKKAQVLFYKTLAWWNSLEFKDTFKWKKKLLLEKYGFIDYKRMITEVNRFKRENIYTVRLLLKKEIELNQENDTIYRVIPVPTQHQYHLPNYIITGKEELEGLEEFYTKNDFDEIWYLSNRPENIGQYSGRLLIFKHGIFSEIVIEMVEGDNLRKLEKYSIGKKDISYFRAVKKMGESSFKIEENHMYDLNSEILRTFDCVKKEVARYDNNIHLMCESLQKYGVRVISMDFRVDDDKLVFLDWDTAEDEKVLKYEFG